MASSLTHSEARASGSESSTDVSSPGTIAAEFAALCPGSGVYPLAARVKLALTGSDRVRWLNGMVTNNVRDLAPGQGVYAFLLNPQGQIQGDLYVYNRGDDVLVDTDSAQREKILAIFDHYIIMDDVVVTDVTASLGAVGLAGPAAAAILRASGFALPAQPEPLRLYNTNRQDIPVTLVVPRTHSYELWIAPEHAPALQSALAAAGAVPVSPEAVEIHRIALGIPRYGQDIRERDLPQETEQSHALHFSKGCYIGQEIVERIRSRGAVHRKFTGFRVTGPLPAPGAKIQSEAKDVGEVTSSARLPWPAGDANVALGYVRRELAVPGKTLQSGEASLTVADLPFADL
jgi:folate-binding protein YgfZ